MSLVVFAVVAAVVGFVVRIFVQGGGGDGACFDGGAKGGGAHLAARSGLLGYEAMLVVVLGRELGVGVVVVVGSFGAEGEALGCGAGSCVGDCEHGDDGPEDDSGGSGATSADEWVAVLIVRLHGDGRQGKVCAVHGDHSGLGQASFGVGLL